MRPLPRLRRRTSDSRAAEPFTRLRRRFVFGAMTSAVVFAAAFIVDLARHTPRDDMVVAGVERAATGTGVSCALAAVMLWGLTLSAEHALSIWRVASRTVAEPYLDDEAAGADAHGRIPAPPIPISRGRDIRKNHHDQHAV